MVEELETRDPGVGRLVGFSDGVVAIAITLIVLPLVDAASSTNKTGAAFLADNRTGLLSAAISFVVIAAFWRDHHRLYRQVTASSRGLVNVNLIWLAGIVFLPLPTVMIVQSPGHDAVAAGLYMATVLIVSIAVRMQELLVVRAGEVRAGVRVSARSLAADWIVPALLLLALITTLVFPITWLWSLGFVWLARPLGWIVRRTAPAGESRQRIL
jgi:uncharacterized membrane protein